MAKIFLSHSSKDKEIVRKLASDLRDLGHFVWLDEWEIVIGDCIVTKIERGLSDCDFVVLVLSPSAVASGWVDREWKSRYWDEITTKRVVILPVLVESCEIPNLLNTKKYADLRTNYAVGFGQLAQVLGSGPVVQNYPPSVAPAAKALIPDYSEVDRLLAKVQRADSSLAECLAEAMPLARKHGDPALEAFCRAEISGYEGKQVDKRDPTFPRHRVVETFCSATAKLNPQFIGWGGSVERAWAFMSQNEEFGRMSTVFGAPIATIERNAAGRERGKEQLTVWERRARDVFSGQGVEAPGDYMITFYARADNDERILIAVRAELTRRLLSLLPSPKT